MPVEAQLRRKNAQGDVVDYVLVDDTDNPDTALSDPTVDYGVRTRLSAILAELGQKLESGGEVALSAATLAALENITVTVSNPTANPETGLATQTTLASILAELGQKLEPGQPVALDQQALDAILTPADVQLQVNGEDISGLNPLPVTSTFANADGVPYDANNRVPVDVGANIVIDNLTVSFESIISTANSPAAPLLANETFVGSWEDVRDYAAIQAVIWTDVASATNGAIVDFSADGTNIARSVATTIAANFQAYFSLAPEARYVRLRYVNGPLPQTFLRAQVKFAYNTPAEVQQPIGATITDANVATVGRSTLAARVYSGAATGMHVPLQSNTSGHLSVRVENQNPATETGLATQATLAAILTELAEKLEAGQAVALDTATLAALETISVANFPAMQTIDGTVTVANPGLTDAQLRATPVPVSFLADEAGLTDAQLRATPVPISGTITANLGTIDGAATEATLAAANTKLGGDLVIREHPLVPKGFEQITTIATASSLTVPSGALYAMIQADTPIRYRDDGANPTSLVGIRLPADGTIFYTGSLSALRIIGVAVGATVNISYYGRT